METSHITLAVALIQKLSGVNNGINVPTIIHSSLKLPLFVCMHGDNIKEYKMGKERLGYLCISVPCSENILNPTQFGSQKSKKLMQFEINIQCFVGGHNYQKLLLLMFNNNEFELDQIYTHPVAIKCAVLLVIHASNMIELYSHLVRV